MAKAKEDEKALTTVTGAENVPAIVDLSEYAGDVDKRSSADLSIPFLNILQPLSPVVVDETVAGAKAGMFYNSVTSELFPGNTGVGFLWCADQKQFVEWAPRETGEGIVAMHEPGAPEVLAAIKANGGKADKDLRIGENSLVETWYIYGLVCDLNFTEVLGFAVFAAKSTNLGPAKKWLTARSMVRHPQIRPIPDYFFRTILTTEKDSNESGTWFKLKASPFGGTGSWKDALNLTNKALLDEAKAFRKMVLDGKAKADFSQERPSGGAGNADVPF